MPIVKEF